MSVLFTGPYYTVLDDAGDPIPNAEVFFYEPGTTTPKDVYTTSDLSTPATNPVVADSAGRVQVFLNGDYTVKVDDADGNQIDTVDNVNPPVTVGTTGSNLIANGSFETQGNSATEAESWTLTPQSDGTVERITSDQYDGAAALKFTSDGSGGGQADTDDFFVVSAGREYEVSFALKCSVADIRNIVKVRYFDKDKSALSNSTVYDEDASNPTSWEVKSFTETPPANAAFAKLQILGADQSDATAGEAKFDGVAVARRDEVVKGTTAFLDEDDMASDSATALASQQSIKAYVDPKLNQPQTSSDPGLSFDTWRTPNADRPTMVFVSVVGQTDGAIDARINLQVDESGGTTSDYYMSIVRVHESLGSNEVSEGSTAIIVPSGGSYQIENAADPANGNSINDHREFTL